VGKVHRHMSQRYAICLIAAASASVWRTRVTVPFHTNRLIGTLISTSLRVKIPHSSVVISDDSEQIGGLPALNMR